MKNESKNPHAVSLGRLGGLKGGKSKSPKKTKSSRENGKKGGRPKKKTSTNSRAGLRKAHFGTESGNE